MPLGNSKGDASWRGGLFPCAESVESSATPIFSSAETGAASDSAPASASSQRGKPPVKRRGPPVPGAPGCSRRRRTRRLPDFPALRGSLYRSAALLREQTKTLRACRDILRAIRREGESVLPPHRNSGARRRPPCRGDSDGDYRSRVFRRHEASKPRGCGHDSTPWLR